RPHDLRHLACSDRRSWLLKKTGPCAHGDSDESSAHAFPGLEWFDLEKTAIKRGEQKMLDGFLNSLLPDSPHESADRSASATSTVRAVPPRSGGLHLPALRTDATARRMAVAAFVRPR